MIRILFYIQFTLLIITNSFGNEIWVNQSKNIREYYSVSINNLNQIIAKKYRQEAGDYQELVSVNSFVSRELFKNYLNLEKNNFKKVVSLDKWSLENNKTDSINKGLFGKKNTYIWETKNQWSDDWEIKYSKWIQENVNTQFYLKYKIKTDCADALVGLRWIFSRLNGLPVANTVADTGELFGNYSMPRKWQKLDSDNDWTKDELFLTALNFIMDLTSSRTVLKDGFPVKIDKNGLIAGTFILTQNNGSGHAKVISETHFEEATELPFYTLASTTPRMVRELVRETFVDPEWPVLTKKEILAFRWPIFQNGTWQLKKPDLHSRYSLEQYDSKFKETYPAFISFILSRVKETLDPVKLVDLGKTEILSYISQRINIVILGNAACKGNSCSPNSEEFENWSTPSRDEKLIHKFQDLDRLVNEFEIIAPGLKEIWFNQLRNTVIDIDGVTLSLANIRYLFEQKFTSIDPNKSIKERWGMDSSKIISQKLLKVEEYLVARNKIFEKATLPCSVDCYPKSSAWLEGDSFHLDKELNSLYVEIKSYCHVIKEENCKESFSFQSNKNLVFQGMSKNLEQWFNTIPKFISDPRVAVQTRWGKLNNDTAVFIFPHYETIKISKNGLGLIDSKKLYELKTGILIYQALEGSRLVLTEAGKIFLISDLTGNLQEVIFENNTVKLINLSDPDNILLNNKNRLITFSEHSGFPLFKKVLAQSIVTFRVKDSNIELVSESLGRMQQNAELIVFSDNRNKLTFIDLQKNSSFEFEILPDQNVKSINKFNVLNYSYPVVFLEYLDQDWGIHYPVKVNLETKQWDIFDIGLVDTFEIKWSQAKLGKALIKNKINNDFPELLALDFSNVKPTLTQLDNNLLDVLVLDSKVYIIESKGSQWDQNLSNKLLCWDKTFENLNTSITGNPLFFHENTIVLNGVDFGKMYDLKNGNLKSIPRNIVKAQESVITSGKTISYGFDTSYGDYYNMGIVESLPNLENKFNQIFSIYTWFNNDDLLDQRWIKSFSESSVSKGTLISIGKNMSIWWDTHE